MYCNKCGKEIESGNMCAECAATSVVSAEPASVAPLAATPANELTRDTVIVKEGWENEMPEPDNRMYGFGKALASTIMSVVGFILVYIWLIASAFDPVTGLVCMILSMPLIIMPLIMGISSIKVFVARKATCAKPLPTLILGIVGVSTAAFSALFAFITFIIAMALVAL